MNPPGESMPPFSPFQRLKERKIVQWALAYLAGAWVVYEASGTALEAWDIPAVLIRAVHVFLVFGFFITLVLAWYHGERGRQKVSGPELLMVAALLVTAGVALKTLGTGEQASQGVEVATPLEDEDSSPSIAVLPLDNLSPDPRDRFFASGVHADITSALGRISSLSVRGRSSVDQFRESRPPIREIASALGVDFLLEGTAQIVGTGVKVSVQLIDGRRDEQLWEGDWQGEYVPAEAIRIQSEIAQGVASELRVAIAPEEEARIAAVPTQDLVAYRLVDRARALWNQRTAPEIREAIDLCSQAIERDPQFVDAYVGLASAYLVLGEYSPDRAEREEADPLAVATAEQALRLDPSLSIPHGIVAWGLADEWDWEGAEGEFLNAIHLEPDQSQVRCWYSYFLAAMGRYEEALRELSIAQRLDPLAPWLAAGAPGVYYFARDYQRSIEVGLQTIAADPGNENVYGWVCGSYLRLGRFEESTEACEMAQESYPDWAYDALEHAFRGEEEAALQDLARVVNAFPGSGDVYWCGAEIHAVLGDIDGALQWLRRAIEEERSFVSQLPGDPAWDVLRSDPRFEEILRETGFEG